MGPTVNMQRTPIGGRNFECFSEDPLLTASLATAYIRGIQRDPVNPNDAHAAACVKHFVCNDVEFGRMWASSEVSERALREIYLPPFLCAVKHGHVCAIMGMVSVVCEPKWDLLLRTYRQTDRQTDRIHLKISN